MAKSAAERKAEQRKRQKQSGVTKIELFLDEQELEMLQKNCALRRPGREPYDVSEYLSMLIRIDDHSLKSVIEKLAERRCKKCSDKLPVTECCMDGDSECWLTRGWHEVKLGIN
ncbi:hypothetical protein AB7X11_11960 [Providencia alcalifaciens]